MFSITKLMPLRTLPMKLGKLVQLPELLSAGPFSQHLEHRTTRMRGSWLRTWHLDHLL
jgi:hypothetical protein